jgi:hypothetical protein
MNWFQGKISQIEIAGHPATGYVLYERVNKSNDNWATLLLMKSFRDEHWEFGWNGSRLSNGHATKLLISNQPDLHQWVLDVLKKAQRN